LRFDRRAAFLAVGAIVAVLLLAVGLFSGGDSDGGSAASDAAGAQVRGTVVVNFAGAPAEKPTVTNRFAVAAESNAWAAVQQALGASNLTYKDFGGDLGVFITGFYGVEAAGNNFWEFRVNGASSEAGVSSYIVKDGDRLEFRYTGF
jgi:hypothetical protein